MAETSDDPGFEIISCTEPTDELRSSAKAAVENDIESFPKSSQKQGYIGGKTEERCAEYLHHGWRVCKVFSRRKDGTAYTPRRAVTSSTAVGLNLLPPSTAPFYSFSMKTNCRVTEQRRKIGSSSSSPFRARCERQMDSSRCSQDLTSSAVQMDCNRWK